MIDYANLKLPYSLKDKLLNNPLVEFNFEYSRKTGLECWPIRGEYYCLKIHIYRKVIRLTGSLHHFYNLRKGKGEHNNNDFTRNCFKDAISLLCQELEMEPANVEITTLEYGVNISTTFSPYTFIEKNVHGYRRKYDPKLYDKFNGKGLYKRFEVAQFALKVYDKGAQYNLSENLLRIEVKTKKSAYLKMLGIKCLSDLFIEVIWLKLGIDLLERYEELLILNDFNTEGLPSYWKDLQRKTSKSTVKRRWREYMLLWETQGQLELKKHVCQLIKEKCTLLVGLTHSDHLVMGNFGSANQQGFH